MGDVETRSEDASGETLNVGYVVAGTVLVLTLAALAHVALEYRKIVELLDLVEACTTDPAKIRGAVEEQVASAAGMLRRRGKLPLRRTGRERTRRAPPAVVAAVENVHREPSSARVNVAVRSSAAAARRTPSGAGPASPPPTPPRKPWTPSPRWTYPMIPRRSSRRTSRRR